MTTITRNRYETIDIEEVPSRLRRTARAALKAGEIIFVEYRQNQRGDIYAALTRHANPVGYESGGQRVTGIELVIDEEA